MIVLHIPYMFFFQVVILKNCIYTSNCIYTRGEINSNPTLSKEQISQSRPFIWLSSNGSDQISQLHSKGSFVDYKSQKYLINFHCKQKKFLTHQPWTAVVVDPPSICLQSAIYPPTICCSAVDLLFHRWSILPPSICCLGGRRSLDLKMRSATVLTVLLSSGSDRKVFPVK